MCSGRKNAIINLRFVCHAFDAILKPYVFKTIQLEFSGFVKNKSSQQITDNVEPDCLPSIGRFTKALFLDLMLVRDSEEMESLNNACSSIIHNFPELGPVLKSLDQLTMGATTFDERDYGGVIQVWILINPCIRNWRFGLHNLKMLINRLRGCSIGLQICTASSLASRFRFFAIVVAQPPYFLLRHSNV